MQKNLYYRTVLRRRNALKEFIFETFLWLCSFPRLLLEVFIKRNMGERYFSFSSAIIIAFIMFSLPIPFYSIIKYAGGSPGSVFWLHLLTWYLYIILFIHQAIQRRKEVKRNPSVFDFERLSLSTGQLRPQVETYIKNFKIRDIRQQEILFEPLPFFIIGIVLIVFGQYIGWVLLVASIVYSISYMAAYYRGDNFVMDLIDEMILNEEKESAFVGDEDPSNARGVRFRARKPTQEEMRRKVADCFNEYENDEVFDAI